MAVNSPYDIPFAEQRGRGGSSPDTLPSTVKVGWKTFRIEEWTSRQGASAQRYGETAHCEARISIDLSHGTRQAASTLYHEILHAVCAVFKFEETDKEERVVALMASGMSTVWRDNPAVMAWIGRHLVDGTD